MRIRKITIFVTLIYIIGYGIFIYFMSSSTAKPIDLAAINDTVKKVEASYDAGRIASPELEAINSIHANGYEVILKTEENYNSYIYAAVQDNCIIMDLESADQIVGKVIFPSQNWKETEYKKQIILAVTALCAGMLLLFYAIEIFLYRKILKPFYAMENFAGKVAEGDLDFPLLMNKENYFGAFTESFDLMREELKNARQGEYEANLSKKELVACLSHDIKTPVATIKALCEILRIKLENDPNHEKINIIYNKADMIDVLINNMFHATLEELNMLKIEPLEELSSIIAPMFHDINHEGRIILKNEIPECLILCDKLRLSQVIDNIIGNSYKYAGTDIFVHAVIEVGYLAIEIRDFGKGVEDKELPMLFEKYYRGQDVLKKSGSGLGLYLAKQFMEGMKGSIECFNDSGFVVRLYIRIV